MAVVDALSGGMEVENPRLATSARPGAARHSVGHRRGRTQAARGGSPDHVEFLDDRVVVFTSVGREPRTFKYALRVIAEGEFALPPIQASCMYDADYASVHGAGRVQVSRYAPGQSRETETAAGEQTGAGVGDLAAELALPIAEGLEAIK